MCEKIENSSVTFGHFCRGQGSRQSWKKIDRQVSISFYVFWTSFGARNSNNMMALRGGWQMLPLKVLIHFLVMQIGSEIHRKKKFSPQKTTKVCREFFFKNWLQNTYTETNLVNLVDKTFLVFFCNKMVHHGIFGVKVRNFKKDFITGGTWRRVGQ